jgi:arginyl-tRNA synthetase
MREALLEQFQRALQRILAEAGDRGELPEFSLEPAREAAHGDFACNAALKLAKRLHQPPRAIAARLLAALGDGGGLIARAEVAGPGFVNVWLRERRWQELLRRVLEEGPAFGRSAVGRGARVQVEFVSANPTGPLTLGHGRNAVLGDCIARLLEAIGCRVTREYYFNNGGRQMRLLGESVRARYLELLGRAAPPPASALADPEASWPESIGGLPVVFPRDGYQGEYIAELARSLREEHGDRLAESGSEEIFRKTAEERIFADIRSTLEALGIRFDVYTNESDLYEDGKLDRTLADLRARGVVYERDGAVWLRTTSFGLDRDRVLVKRTGEPTYLLPDIAYHREKFRRGFERVIDVLGADHIEQFPSVRAAVEALGCPGEAIELVMHQFVTLTSGGKQVKQSTRRATYVTVDELLSDVGPDVFRFFMVQRRAEGHLDFDLDLARETDWNKNPAYYLQYAHARSCGLERMARDRGVEIPTASSVDATPLALPEEIDVLKKLAEFPDLVCQAAAAREPHHLAYYARELAGQWNPYLQDGVRHRVLSDDAALTNARLGLALAVRTVLGNALALLGISAPERM